MIVRAIVAVCLVALLYACGRAYASVTRPPLRNVHAALVVCDGWAEDSAAHVRLRSYDDGRAVYVCERRGY